MASWKKFGSGEYGSGVFEIAEVDKDLNVAGGFCAKTAGEFSRDLRPSLFAGEVRRFRRRHSPSEPESTQRFGTHLLQLESELAYALKSGYEIGIDRFRCGDMHKKERVESALMTEPHPRAFATNCSR